MFHLTNSPVNIAYRTTSLGNWGISGGLIVSGGYPAASGKNEAFLLTVDSTVSTSYSCIVQTTSISYFADKLNHIFSLDIKKYSSPSFTLYLGYISNSGTYASPPNHFFFGPDNSLRVVSNSPDNIIVDRLSNGWSRLHISVKEDSIAYLKRIYFRIHPTCSSTSSLSYGSLLVNAPSVYGTTARRAPYYPNTDASLPLGDTILPEASSVRIEYPNRLKYSGKLNGKSYTTRSGKPRMYQQGGYRSVEMEVEDASSLQNSLIHAWWSSATNLVLSDYASGNVMQCRVINKQNPLSKVSETTELDRFSGVLEMETYNDV